VQIRAWGWRRIQVRGGSLRPQGWRKRRHVCERERKSKASKMAEILTSSAKQVFYSRISDSLYDVAPFEIGRKALSFCLTLLSPPTSTIALSVAGNKAISYRVNLPCATGHRRNNQTTPSFNLTHKQTYVQRYVCNERDVIATDWGKEIPLQAWTDPEGSRRVRLSQMSRQSVHEGGKVVSHVPPAFTLQEIFLVQWCW